MCTAIIIQFRSCKTDTLTRLSQHPSFGPSPWLDTSSGYGYWWPPDIQWLLIYWISCGQQTNNGPPARQGANTPWRKNLTCYGMEQTDRETATTWMAIQKPWWYRCRQWIRAHKTNSSRTGSDGTMHYEILELIYSIWTRDEKPQSRKSHSASLSYTKGKGQGVVIATAATYQLPTKFYPTSFSQV